MFKWTKIINVLLASPPMKYFHFKNIFFNIRWRRVSVPAIVPRDGRRREVDLRFRRLRARGPEVVRPSRVRGRSKRLDRSRGRTNEWAGWCRTCGFFVGSETG
jgi:hypothetical protein